MIEYPKLFSEFEIDAKVPKHEVTHYDPKGGPSLAQRRKEAVRIVHARFERIYHQLTKVWGTKEGSRYLQSLIVDDRDNRQGFPPEVFKALLFLSVYHDNKYGFETEDPAKFKFGR